MGLYLACQRGKHPACSDGRQCSCECHKQPSLAVKFARDRLLTYAILGSIFQEQRVALDAERKTE